MIRKIIIVMLTSAAVASGTIGFLSGSRFIDWRQTLWSSGESDTSGYRAVFLHLEQSSVTVYSAELFDAPAVPYVRSDFGLWWSYINVLERNASGLAHRYFMVQVHYVIPVLLAFLFSFYPTMVLIRGTLQYWRRLREGSCLNCAYDLTGNVTGVCSECGAQIQSIQRTTQSEERVYRHIGMKPEWYPQTYREMFKVAMLFGLSGPLRRWRRRRKGLCVNCAYNLTGNESGVCPECRTKIEGTTSRRT